MTIEAPSRNLPQAAPLPSTPAQIGPGGVARSGKGNAAPPEAVPPPPSEPELMKALSPPEAARIAVEAFHELQGELQDLEKTHSASTTPLDAKKRETLIDAKRHEVTLAQKWAIQAATKNRDLVAPEDKAAGDLNKKLHSEADELSQKLQWNEGGHERSRLSLLEVDAVKAEAAYNEVHARFLDAESLLQQANASPEGHLKSAENDLESAKKRYFAADMKLKAAEGQPHPDPRIVVPTRKELESARAGQAAAFHHLEVAREIDAHTREKAKGGQ